MHMNASHRFLEGPVGHCWLFFCLRVFRLKMTNPQIMNQPWIVSEWIIGWFIIVASHNVGHTQSCSWSSKGGGALRLLPLLLFFDDQLPPTNWRLENVLKRIKKINKRDVWVKLRHLQWRGALTHPQVRQEGPLLHPQPSLTLVVEQRHVSIFLDIGFQTSLKYDHILYDIWYMILYIICQIKWIFIHHILCIDFLYYYYYLILVFIIGLITSG